MREDVKTMVILNEKEACIMFPTSYGNPDMSEGLCSKEARFHEWCLDYFAHCWDTAEPFSEGRLKNA